jgi:hypothetical protein
MSEEYQPFGPEWEKEMNRFPKSVLIKLYKAKCIELIELKEQFDTQSQVDTKQE